MFFDMDYLVPFSYCNKSGRIEHIRRYIERHSDRKITAIEIAKVFGIVPDTVCRYVFEESLAIPTFKRRIEKRDELIRKGFSLGKMASILDLAEETIRKYIIRTDQYEIWRNARKTSEYL